MMTFDLLRSVESGQGHTASVLNQELEMQIMVSCSYLKSLGIHTPIAARLSKFQQLLFWG